MPIVYLKNAKGEVYQVEQAEAEDAKRLNGMVDATPEEVDADNQQITRQKELDAETFGETLSRRGQTVKEGLTRAPYALGAAAGLLPKPVSAAAQAELTGEEYPGQSQALDPFSAAARERKAKAPFIAAASESAPAIVAGAALAGSGVGLGAFALAQTAESTIAGLSQEAIDAVTEKRDVSAWNVLTNGLVDAAFGTITFGAFKGAGKLLGKAAGKATGTADNAAAAVTKPRMKRNWISEQDPGEVPMMGRGGTGAMTRGGRPARSVGAAAAVDDDVIPQNTILDVSVNDAELVDEARSVMGGNWKTTEKGAAQDGFDAFRVVSNNKIKHEDFVAAAPTDPAVRAALDTERAALADEIASVGNVLGEHGSKSRKVALGLLSQELEDAPLEHVASIMDRSKQLLDKIYMITNADKTNPIRSEEIKHALKPVVERARKTLENPAMVGARIAEIQSGRNLAWSDPVNGFIRNIQVAETLGVKLFKKIDVDYETGQLVMQYDPSAFKQLLDLDIHEAKPVLEGWAAVLDSMDRIGQNVVESGADSAARAPLAQMTENVAKMRKVFEFIATRLEVNRMTSTGAAGMVEGAGKVAEGLPVLGDFIKTMRKGGIVNRAEGAAKAALAKPLATGSQAKSLSRLERALGHAPANDTGARIDRALSQPPANDGGAVPHGPRRGLPPGAAGAAAGIGAVGAAGAILAPGEAGAAEPPLLPAEQASRQALAQHLATLPPEKHAALARTAQSLARIGKQTETKVRGAVADLFLLARDPNAKPRYRSPKAREIDRRAAELDVPRAVARFMGRKTDDPVEAWQQKSSMLARVVADPSELARNMADNLGDLSEVQPEIFTKVVAQTMRTVEYLHSKLPQASGKSAFSPDGYPPMNEEITEFAGHWVGALHALDTLDDLAANDLMPEQMDAVRTLWPEAYAMFQTTALDSIADVRRRGGIIPMDAIEQIDSALSLNGAGEPLLTAEFAAMLRAAEQQVAASGQQPAPAPSQSQPTSAERLVSSSLASFTTGAEQ